MSVQATGSCLVTVLLAAGFALASGAPAAAAPSTATAPGRVVVDVGDRALLPTGIPVGALQAPIPEPAGSMLLMVAPNPSATTYRFVRIGLDGALDRSFGDAGVKSVDLPGVVAYDVKQIVRQPDGKLLVVTSVHGDGFAVSLARVTRLNADLSVDAFYGAGGSVTTGPVDPKDAVLQRDGSLLLTGSTDGVPASTPQRLNLRWSLTRVTAAGAVDTSFGVGGIATIPTQVTTYGESVGLGPGATIVAVGHEIEPGPSSAVLTRLTAAGRPDPSFAGGLPVKVPLGYTRAMVVRGNGSVLLEGRPLKRKGSDGHEPQALVRYTVAGTLDPTYGTAGIAYFGDDVSPSTVLALPGGGALVSGLLYTPAADGTFPQPGHLEIRRLSARGKVTLRRSLRLPFGGGSAGSYFGEPGKQRSVLQNSFYGSGLLPRPDGTFLVAGAVGLSQPTGDGEEVAINRFAAAVLTPSLRLDGSFGGPVGRLRVSVKLPAQQAAAAVREGAISVELRASAIGLAQVQIAHRGRLIARNLLALFVTARHALPVKLTPYGKRYLSSHPGAKLSIAVSARDLLAGAGHAHASGRLR